MKPDLAPIKETLQKLSKSELEQINLWLQQVLRPAESGQAQKKNSDENTIEKTEKDHHTYRLEYTSCGKPQCKCTDGNLHGPYWYAYWTENGKTKKRYIGKKLPSKR